MTAPPIEEIVFMPEWYNLPKQTSISDQKRGDLLRILPEDKDYKYISKEFYERLRETLRIHASARAKDLTP